MELKTVVIALGANLGDKEATLASTRAMLTERIGPVVAASEEMITPAWGVVDQPDFLNQVLAIRPTVFLGRFEGAEPIEGLHQLLTVTQQIERALGRKRGRRWGPRSCDIDLIFADRYEVATERLTLPHPWWRQRDFVGGILERELPEYLLFGPR